MDSLRTDLRETTHVRPQHFRNGYAAILILVVFHDSYKSAAHSGTRAVQRMDEAVALAVLVLVAGIHAPGLEVAADRAGRDFAIGVLAGQPDLDVVSLAGAKTHVARAQRHGAVWQAEPLQHFLCALRHALVFGDRAFLVGDGDQLDLVELVLAQHAAGVAAGRARFRPEARGERGEPQRQPVMRDDLLAHQIGQRHLRRRDEAEPALAMRREEQVFLEEAEWVSTKLL